MQLTEWLLQNGFEKVFSDTSNNSVVFDYSFPDLGNITLAFAANLLSSTQSSEDEEELKWISIGTFPPFLFKEDDILNAAITCQTINQKISFRPMNPYLYPVDGGIKIVLVYNYLVPDSSLIANDWEPIVTYFVDAAKQAIPIIMRNACS